MESSLYYETERLIIRPTNLDDAPFIFELLNSPKWKENIGDRNVRSIEDAAAYIEGKMLVQLREKGFGNNTLIRKSDGTKVGTCGLYDREGLEGVDIGFALLPEYERMGYALEAALKVKQIAVEEFNMRRISGITLPSNKASQELLKKLGLSYSKTNTLPGDSEELLLFSLDL